MAEKKILRLLEPKKKYFAKKKMPNLPPQISNGPSLAQ